MEYKPRGKPRLTAFKEITLENGTIIGIFQGSRGENPDLDILIKYKEPKKRIRTPKHIHWVIDILLKKQHEPKLAMEFINYLRNMYDNVDAFETKKQQQNCQLKETSIEKLKKFNVLNKYGEYSVEFIGHLIELMIIMEKTGKKDAHVFKDLMNSLVEEKDIFAVVSKATQVK